MRLGMKRFVLIIVLTWVVVSGGLFMTIGSDTGLHPDDQPIRITPL
jgi:hypothetical protein